MYWAKINSSEKGNHEKYKCKIWKEIPRINRMLTLYFPNINVLMYKNIDTHKSTKRHQYNYVLNHIIFERYFKKDIQNNKSIYSKIAEKHKF